MRSKYFQKLVGTIQFEYFVSSFRKNSSLMSDEKHDLKYMNFLDNLSKTYNFNGNLIKFSKNFITFIPALLITLATALVVIIL
jgi:hypothetical protein